MLLYFYMGFEDFNNIEVVEPVDQEEEDITRQEAEDITEKGLKELEESIKEIKKGERNN